MPLNGNDWGVLVAAEVSPVGLNASEISSIETFWKKICTVHVSYLTANTLVQTITGAPDSEHTGVIS